VAFPIDNKQEQRIVIFVARENFEPATQPAPDGGMSSCAAQLRQIAKTRQE
jgi:hypothetical protein